MEQPLRAAVATGLAIEPAYRARALGLLAAFYRQTDVDLFLTTTAIEAVGKLAQALKAAVLPQPDYETVFFWVLNPYRFGKAVGLKFGASGLTTSLLGAAASLALRADRVVQQRRPRRPASSAPISACSIPQIDTEFDRLWHAKLAEKPRVMADRSASVLRWHFTLAGDRRECVVLCSWAQSRLVGYAIVQYSIDRQTGLRRAVLADLLVQEDAEPPTEALLWAALTNARTHGSDVFEVLGFTSEVRKLLRSWHPYLRTYPACPFLYKLRELGLQPVLAQPEAWYATPFDGDTTLMP